MNNSPIPVKLSMIHKKIQEKNHQNWWTYIDWKIAAKLGKNQSPKTVKISMNPQKILQKCHQNWWKSDGFTRICTNFVENQVGLLYALNCHVTKIVINSGSCQNCNQCLKCHKAIGLYLS